MFSDRFLLFLLNVWRSMACSWKYSLNLSERSLSLNFTMVYPLSKAVISKILSWMQKWLGSQTSESSADKVGTEVISALIGIAAIIPKWSEFCYDKSVQTAACLKQKSCSKLIGRSASDKNQDQPESNDKLWGCSRLVLEFPIDLCEISHF